jgi:4-amino-4-deoxy-L-arabinose transferase-like glycosyltransferase
MKEAKSSRLIMPLIIFFITFVAAAYSLEVIKVPVFADGTQHVWITDYVKLYGELPKTDITGIQPTNLSIPISIKDPEPFIYSPLFYTLTGALTTFGISAKTAVEIMNILPPIAIGLFFYLISKRIFNQNIAILAFVLIVLSSIWPWMAVHRLVEPTIILLFTSLAYSFYVFSKRNSTTFPLIAIFMASLFAIKQSVYPILIAAILTLLVLRKLKYATIIFMLFTILIIPILLYSMKILHAPIPTPTGISIIDKQFKGAWWNQPEQKWEKSMDAEVNAKALKETTQLQFKQVQKSPLNLYDYAGISGLINEFNLYPVSGRSTEGYQSTVPYQLYLIFLLIFFIGIIALIEPKWRKNITNEARVPFTFLVITLLLATFFWFKQPVFRYYIYVLMISTLILALGIEFILRRSHKYIGIGLILILITLINYNLVSEVNRDKQYVHTAMHKTIPSRGGGLVDSENFGAQIQSDSSNKIFTPMVEIAYYSRKSQLWDDRLFFAKNKKSLSNYLTHYNFNYVVLPFYSGASTKASWTYDQGVPSDSSFYELLNDPHYFKIVKHNQTFTAYKRI